MATNNRPLKAYIRYDGSNRVVAGSLILRKNKPKVGKWKEISAYECCNLTTTSTTTIAPTTTTTTTLGINCLEYLVTNNDVTPGFLSYINCNNVEINVGLLNPGDFRQFCANANAAGGGIITSLFTPTIESLGFCRL
tara:strand:+ start:290 stop:700 length:411 start_codon:yes stop_codon:yes gene_type:complete